MKKLMAVLMVMCLLAATFPALAGGWGGLGGLLDDMGLGELGGMVDAVTGVMELGRTKDGKMDVTTLFTGGTTTVKVDGRKYTVHEAFKQAMDEYEAFYDEYITFMTSDGTNWSAYGSMMERLARMEELLDALDSTRMTADEDAYFTAVQLRVNTKLMNAIK